MGIFGNKKIKAFGLDISDSSIKVMQLAQTATGLVPSAFANVPLADKVIKNSMIVNEQKLADNIKVVLASAGKIETNRVVCSIPEAKSFVRNLSLPLMEESEIDGAVPYELEQEIPLPIDQVYLDWQVIKRGRDRLDLLVMASPKAYVDALIESLKLARLTPIAMELESQATARSLIASADLQKNILIVDLATKQTSFILVEAGVIQYTSSVPLAGRALTESIARSFNVPLEAAEKLKQGAGLIAQVDGISLTQALTPILDGLVEEIRKILKFFTDRDPAQPQIDTILLCGGTAKLAGLSDYLSSKINTADGAGIEVRLGNPWANTAANPTIAQVEALGFTTVTGLALRGITNETY
ncbi:MAG: hypothetical protein A3J07_04415 [Candidatus Doudnabacteria bacterium RIFCSPLOWO2_02_FULL_49_13]|uniref:SHS2 domain-containing protein n=1 Tax=Candidatus Doudnabacteria bacterium RIFCSPHIGHO2_12_FULL_48_16 TaxID=1817838 RepID=A0A1F5PK24_9BACT|nr:MAG: hypothetical protein A3B77_03150 [Candidatus Doudnabacteria bacterium RIFCSPHIGHO2_02_FULL_49_24]OGE89116.1 MAG: hypothetical protein A2760_04085 [Candidatus Doudnabacteria bacterium RIFCSPHIGHO2_01_FULL_50_67]OGE90154.1 MAG: hypothetical protein A3E29_03555 [Candidatus Doudnabacteria bacterium RIFCSPHIGHO2_12_FULL_48_16]OGE97223.1 MAG: hypothetical protein A2990_01350 [Candidatus Doudnabacteria bacterium RIFCSPLOWO2_01_FULL_49_40]OGF03296.1 MAG: hypothetical protein A3J07_04415 [Candid